MAPIAVEWSLFLIYVAWEIRNEVAFKRRTGKWRVACCWRAWRLAFGGARLEDVERAMKGR